MSGNITLFDCNTMNPYHGRSLSVTIRWQAVQVIRNELSDLNVGNSKDITCVDCSRTRLWKGYG